MKKGALLQDIKNFCSKELKSVDCNFEKSNQHEFNVNKEMKKMLGTNEKNYESSYWLYINDLEQVHAKDNLSWYDARKNHPTRSEWRLYYGGNDAIEKAKEGDWLFIIQVSEESLILLIVAKESKSLLGLRYLLGESLEYLSMEDEYLERIYDAINDVILKTLEREGEEEEAQAIQDAEQYDIVDNVLVRNTMLQISFNSLISGIEQGDYIIPGFQRFYRWKEEQVENLAISFIRGMPIPPIYCYRNKKHQLVILDGQQRILSLYLYYKGEYFKRKRNVSADLRNVGKRENSIPEMLKNYEMKKKKYSMKMRIEDGKVNTVDITYQNLSKEVKRQIDYFTLTIISIDIDKDDCRDSMLHKIFANLNTGGTPLSNQELRNGIYYNDFYIMLFNLNKDNSKWRMLYGGSLNSKENKKSKDVEILLRMCAFFYYTTINNGVVNIKNYKDNMSLFLDEFSRETEKFSMDQIQEYKILLELFFEYMEDASGKNKYSGLVSFFVVWSILRKKNKITSTDFKRITENERYKATTISHTSGRNIIEKRFEYVYEELSKID